MQWSSHNPARDEKKAIAGPVLGLCGADGWPRVVSVPFAIPSRTEGDSVV